MTYSNVRDVVKAKASQIGLNKSLYSTHSMRAGGATAAANAGTSERILQKHGRWASSQSKDRYVKDSLSKRLKVSKSLLDEIVNLRFEIVCTIGLRFTCPSS